MARSNFIMFDWAAKRLLRQKSNFVVLEGFLSALLGEAIRIERILESEGNKEDSEDKFNRVDMLAENSKGEMVIIEIQNNRELDYFHRMLYGTSKVITEYISEGDSFAIIKKVYSINIVYFDLGQGNDYVYHGLTEFRGIHTNDVLQLSANQQKQFVHKEVGRLFPEYYVIRVDEFDKKAVTPLDEWISFLKTGDIPEDAKAGGLAEARERLRRDSLSREEQRIYDAHLEALRYQRSVIQTGLFEGHEKGIDEGIEIGIKKGRMEGREEGLKEGIERGLKSVAERALKDGMSPEAVMKLTGLTREEISSLI
ncbi:MAG: Rpn family recombination-promoting nuclease/putative transposase [Dysgonamonadaceae bacterium]|jgi:predicted transposase/invertase (TIGR01784 family)|nr:Rpn family recombination-promoting nuclease/putative transposase [Dysgonamonadaceae bacterium]